MRRLSFASCLLALLALLVACVSPDDTWDRVRASGVLRVGMDASFPPFEAVSAGGMLAGFDVDLARELGRRLGVEAHFVANLPYDGLYDALAVGRVDVVISALVVNPAKTADFAYSRPYLDAGQVIVVREGEVSLRGVSDLAGRTLAVEFGGRGDMEARRWARRMPDLSLLPFATSAEALAAVRAGDVDAAVVDYVSALAAMRPGLEIIEPSLIEEPYAVAVRRDSYQLLQGIDDALVAMEADGTLDTLVARWLEGGG